MRTKALPLDMGILSRVSFNEKTLWYEILNDTATGPDQTMIEPETRDYHISNHPNPCSDYTIIEFELPENQQVELSLLNPQGKVLQTDQLFALKDKVMRTELNVSHYPQGIYFYGLRLESGQMVVNKLIIN
jgi:hypothetical protein